MIIPSVKQKPYDWQLQCLNAWILNDMRGIIKVVTGAGKSLVGLMGIEYLWRLNIRPQVIIIVPSKVLLLQWERNLIQKCNVNKNLIQKHGGGFKGRLNVEKVFHIFIINSARNKLQRHVQSFPKNTKFFMVADECHRYGSKHNSTIFDCHFDYTLGLSATPEREYDDGFEEIILPNMGDIIFHYKYSDAIHDGVIPPFKLTNIGITLTNRETAEYENITESIRENLHRIYTKYPFTKRHPKFFAVLQKIQNERGERGEEPDPEITSLLGQTSRRRRLLHRAKNRLECFRYLISRFWRNTKIVIFHELIEEIDFIEDILNSIGIPYFIYHSKQKEKENLEAIRSYSQQKNSVLLACKALDEGLDIPDTHIGIIVAATKSTRQRIQRIGRILRKSDNKDYSWIITIYALETDEERRYDVLREKDLFGPKSQIEYQEFSSGFSI